MIDLGLDQAVFIYHDVNRPVTLLSRIQETDRERVQTLPRGEVSQYTSHKKISTALWIGVDRIYSFRFGPVVDKLLCIEVAIYTVKRGYGVRHRIP